MRRNCPTSSRGGYGGRGGSNGRGGRTGGHNTYRNGQNYASPLLSALTRGMDDEEV